jgi:hypothetical protein
MAEYYKSSTSGKRRINLIEPLAIVHGYDAAALKYCARQLLALGYTRFGIGPMAHLYDTKEIVKRVERGVNVKGC